MSKSGWEEEQKQAEQKQREEEKKKDKVAQKTQISAENFQTLLARVTLGSALQAGDIQLLLAASKALGNEALCRVLAETLPESPALMGNIPGYGEDSPVWSVEPAKPQIAEMPDYGPLEGAK